MNDSNFRNEWLIKKIENLFDTYDRILYKGELFISDYFDDLINQIDYETEFNIVDNKQDNFKNERLNQLRDDMLNVINLNRLEMISEYRSMFASTSSLFISYQVILNNLRFNFKRLSLKNDSNHNEFIYLHNQLEKRLNDLRRIIFLNRSIFYVPNASCESDFNLLTIKEEIEVEHQKRNELEIRRTTQTKPIQAQLNNRKPSDIGHLIVIHNFFMNPDEIQLFK